MSTSTARNWQASGAKYPVRLSRFVDMWDRLQRMWDRVVTIVFWTRLVIVSAFYLGVIGLGIALREWHLVLDLTSLPLVIGLVLWRLDAASARKDREGVLAYMGSLEMPSETLAVAWIPRRFRTPPVPTPPAR